MLLKLRDSKLMVEVDDLKRLMNPYAGEVNGCLQWGEEEQDPKPYRKEELRFPSGEDLPRCWRDAHYRDDEIPQH